jgi:predicted N-acyltransferase
LERLRVVESLAGIPAAQWNALAGPNPFLRHEFLGALIDSGCVCARTGWQPQFLLLERAGALAGAMPLYVKSHSRGEYVFDWAWADAYAQQCRAGPPRQSVHRPPAPSGRRGPACRFRRSRTRCE